MLSEGRHEISAIRQRLAAAKARASAAKKTMHSTQRMLESAKRMLENAKRTAESAREDSDGSKNEVKAVEALLKEAEERWEVIDVDGTSSAEAAAAAAPSSKRRKVSASTSEGVRQNDAPVDAAAGRSSSGTCAIGGASDASDAAATTHASNGNGYNGDSLVVVVEGCGLPEVNGTFERNANRVDGCYSYVKEGQWNGKNAEYWIWCASAGVWEITVDSGRTTNWLYFSHTIPNSETPPENGWTMYRWGKSPAPICRITCADP